MFLFYADDAARTASRQGMGPLVAVGGVYLPGEAVRDLEYAIDTLCEQYGFPPGESFKWSPAREMWMWANLIEDRRTAFYLDLVALLSQASAKGLVVIEDKTKRTATDAPTAELDVTQLFLERVHNRLPWDRHGLVVFSTPSGDRSAEQHFLEQCLDTIRRGAKYVKLNKIATVLATPFRLSRLLQAADIIVSCTTAAVAGEVRYSPPVFNCFRDLFPRELGRAGGIGLKIHPDYLYANLYHWLLGDSHFVRFNTGIPLPSASRPYSVSPDRP